MMDLVWLGAVAVVLVAVLVFSANDNARTVAAHKSALRRRFERDPDVSFEVQNRGEDRRLVHAYFGEQAFYIGKLVGEFDERNVLTPNVVRAWGIEKTPYAANGAAGMRHSVDIHTTRIDRALVRIACRDASEAHMVLETVNQALGARVGA